MLDTLPSQASSPKLRPVEGNYLKIPYVQASVSAFLAPKPPNNLFYSTSQKILMPELPLPSKEGFQEIVTAKNSLCFWLTVKTLTSAELIFLSASDDWTATNFTI